MLLVSFFHIIYDICDSLERVSYFKINDMVNIKLGSVLVKRDFAFIVKN